MGSRLVDGLGSLDRVDLDAELWAAPVAPDGMTEHT